MAGGTALAIQLGHRESIDLDFFSQKYFSTNKLKNKISSIGEFTVEYEDDITLDGILDGVKLSFFYYEHKLLFPLIDFEKIKLADAKDISAMKIDAVSSRGSKKDFVDIYFLMQEYGLPEILTFFTEKYKGVKYNKLHILKSLSYFEDADKEPELRMLKNIEWTEIKKVISKEVQEELKVNKLIYG